MLGDCIPIEGSASRRDGDGSGRSRGDSDRRSGSDSTAEGFGRRIDGEEEDVV